MKPKVTTFLDTSILVPVFLAEHPNHRASLALFSACSPATSFCAAHSLAEVYSTLTRMPAPHRASPHHALQCIRKIVSHLSIVSLDAISLITTLQDAATRNLAGGMIYDALIASCALQAHADQIYTWNNRHFARCGPEIASRLSTPASQT